MKITIDKIIDKIAEFRKQALSGDYIQKPFAWALYQTWKWVDQNEKPRSLTMDARHIDSSNS